ncbi:MAG: hypothetical protein K6T59_11600, partial [Bryobacteraceae bacterium]|nr:hypothetical protein [Bryobacteraceae bacterium]
MRYLEINSLPKRNRLIKRAGVRETDKRPEKPAIEPRRFPQLEARFLKRGRHGPHDEAPRPLAIDAGILEG